MNIDQEMNNVINRIRKIRQEQNMSQLELATIANFSQSFLANVESGKKKPSVMTILRIAKALNVNPREFFSESDYNSKDEIKTKIHYMLEKL